MLRVLLADDHVVVRQGLCALLLQWGLAVVAEAADGRAAVELAQRLRPDVAVLDILMPLLNGMDAAHEIARTCPETAMILLSMHGGDRYVWTPSVMVCAGSSLRPRLLKTS